VKVNSFYELMMLELSSEEIYKL